MALTCSSRWMSLEDTVMRWEKWSSHGTLCPLEQRRLFYWWQMAQCVMKVQFLSFYHYSSDAHLLSLVSTTSIPSTEKKMFWYDWPHTRIQLEMSQFCHRLTRGRKHELLWLCCTLGQTFVSVSDMVWDKKVNITRITSSCFIAQDILFYAYVHGLLYRRLLHWMWQRLKDTTLGAYGFCWCWLWMSALMP